MRDFLFGNISGDTKRAFLLFLFVTALLYLFFHAIQETIFSLHAFCIIISQVSLFHSFSSLSQVFLFYFFSSLSFPQRKATALLHTQANTFLAQTQPPPQHRHDLAQSLFLS